MKYYNKGILWFEDKKEISSLNLNNIEKSKSFATETGRYKILDKKILFFVKRLNHPFPRIFKGKIELINGKFKILGRVTGAIFIIMGLFFLVSVIFSLMIYTLNIIIWFFPLLLSSFVLYIFILSFKKERNLLKKCSLEIIEKTYYNNDMVRK